MRWSRHVGSSLIKHYPILDVKTKSMSHDDIAVIWNSISQLVERHLDKMKGINLPGIGTFAYVTKHTDLGMNVIESEQYPIFIIEDKLALSYGLRRPSTFIKGDIPVLRLNFAALGSLLACEDPRLRLCYTSIIRKIDNHIAYNQPFELPFPGVGKLKYVRYSYRFLFNPDFMSTHRVIESTKRKPSDAAAAAASYDTTCECDFGIEGSSCDLHGTLKPKGKHGQAKIRKQMEVTRTIGQARSIDQQLMKEVPSADEIIRANERYDIANMKPLKRAKTAIPPAKLNFQKSDTCQLLHSPPLIKSYSAEAAAEGWQHHPHAHGVFYKDRKPAGKDRQQPMNQFTKGDGDKNENYSYNLSQLDDHICCECIETDNKIPTRDSIPNKTNESPECICCQCEDQDEPDLESADAKKKHVQPFGKSQSEHDIRTNVEHAAVPQRSRTSRCPQLSGKQECGWCCRPICDKYKMAQSRVPVAFRMDKDICDPIWYCEECKSRAFLEFTEHSKCSMKEKLRREEIAYRQFQRLQNEEEHISEQLAAEKKRENLRKDSLANKFHGEELDRLRSYAKAIADDSKNQYVFWSRPKTANKGEINKVAGNDLKRQIRCREQQAKREAEREMKEGIDQRNFFIHRFASDEDEARQKKKIDQHEMLNALAYQIQNKRILTEPGGAFVLPWEQRERHLKWAKKREARELDEMWNTHLREKAQMEREQKDEIDSEAKLLASAGDATGEDTGWKYWKKQAKHDEAIKNYCQGMKEKYERDMLDKLYWQFHAPTNVLPAQQRRCCQCCRLFDMEAKEHAKWRMQERWPFRDMHHSLST